MKKVLLRKVFSAKYLVDQKGVVYNLMQVNDNQININPRKYCLEEILEQITDENRHESIFATEKPRGNEIW